MREGLRSSTVSQRSGTESVRKRERIEASNEGKLGSDVGLSGNSDRARNILPDLNTVANPSEFDSDWLFEGGYADDGIGDESVKQKEVDTACEGEIGKDLMEQKVEEEVHGELRRSGCKMIDMNVDAAECDESGFSDLCAGEEEMVLEKDKIGDVDQILPQNVVSNLGINNGPVEDKMGKYSIDLNVGDDSSDLLSKPVPSGSCIENVISNMESLEDMDIDSLKANALEKEKLQIGVRVLRSRVVGSGGWLSETDTVSQKTSSQEEDKLQVGGKVLRSRVVGSGLFSENFTCSTGNSGDRLDTVNQKTSSPEEDKREVGGKVLRSRVVGSGLCSEITCSMDSPGDVVDTVNRKMGSPEEDKLQSGGRVLRSRVVVPVARRKTATDCPENESEIRSDGCIEHFDGQSKKHKGTPGTVIEEENNFLRNGLHGEEACVEEMKNDESNDGENKRDGDCLRSSLSNMIEKDQIVAENLSKNTSKELVVAPKKKVGRGRPRKQQSDSVSTSSLLKNDESNALYVGNKRDDDCLGTLREKEENAGSLNNMVEKDETAAEDPNNNITKQLVVVPKKKAGRGRPRKQHVDNVSTSFLLENIENPLENHLTDHTENQQIGRPEKSKKRKRGRPKKIDKKMDAMKLNQHDWAGTYKAGKGRKKKGRRRFAEGSKNPSGGGQIINTLNIDEGKDSERAYAAGNKLNLEGSNKRKRGRPRKIRMENDGPEPIPEDQEEAVMVKEDTDHLGGSKKRKRGRPRTLNMENGAAEPIPEDQEGSVMVKEDARLKKQIVEGEGKASSSSSRLKKKRKSTGEESSEGKSNLSPEGKLKVKNSSTREEKGLVRQQIVDMLLSAGWTVEYKPRQGKDYADSVYRSPEGRTHWSVTLAYRVLKQQVETGKAANFCFTPIPDEKLSTLFRIQVKARSDKHKPKQSSSSVKSSGKSKGRKKVDAITNSVSKRKSGNKNRRGCALLVRGSEEFMAVSGKHSVLSWMILSGEIPTGGKVYYRRRAKVLLEGSIRKDGILCNCCSKIHSVAQFEAHSGSNRSCSSYQNLYLENGSSLLQSQTELWNKQDESIRSGFHKVNVDDNDPNDDTCGICGDGGNLICCDGCPSTFHQACLNILNFPSGDWHCVYCSCKYCGTAGGVDQDNENHETSSILLTCSLCDGKYHRLCAYEKEGECGLSNGSAFCGKICEQIYEYFQWLVGVRTEVGDGYTCTFIRRPESQDITSRSDAFEPKEVENMSKLAVALSVMDECFLPIIDHRSGINLMRHTLYSCGSNFKRLNFRGFFTAILEKGDEIIAAASIRIHGKELAEMPFIGTRNAYRRKGMCRRLLSGIELALRSLGIQKLVIPAVSEVVETWTSAFGFEPLGGLGSEMRHMNVIVFPGVDMLQKPLDSGREAVDIKPDGFCDNSHAEENGCIETKAEDGVISEKSEPSIEELQDSAENGIGVPLKIAAVDQEEGRNTERITVHTTEENNQIPEDEVLAVGACDHMVLSSENHVLVERLSLTGNYASEDIDGTTGVTVFEDSISRLAEGAVDPSSNSICNGPLPTSVSDINNPDNNNFNGAEVIAKTPEEASDTERVCSDPDHTTESNQTTLVKEDGFPDGASSDHIAISSEKTVLVANLDSAESNYYNDPSLAEFTVQPSSSINQTKLEVEVINPLENGDVNPSSNLLCNGDLPSTVVEDLAAGKDLLSVTNKSILNVTQVTAKNPESDLQIDCNVVAQFNLEKSCNMDSGSNDLASPVPFHACSAPEV